MSITKHNVAPAESIILNRFGRVDYFECYKVQVHNPGSVDYLTSRIFTLPKWAYYLMALRDFIASKLSLRPVSRSKPVVVPVYLVGAKAVLFTVIARNENEIVMEERDKHLDFRTSVMVVRGTPRHLYWSTTIRFHNWFGRLYFYLIRPIHTLIVRSLLARIGKSDS